VFIRIGNNKSFRYSRKRGSKTATHRYVSDDRYTVKVLMTEDGVKILTEDGLEIIIET